MKKTLATIAILAAVATSMAGCRAAERASSNLSKAADNFEVNRRVVFFNGITDEYLLNIEGLCSIQPDAEEAQLEVTCRIGPDQYKKHFLGLSDNVTYFVEHLEPNDASLYHYRVDFHPEAIIPDILIDTGRQ